MDQLEFLLLQFLVPDNAARKAAEEQIRKLSKDSQIVPALLHHIRTAQAPNVRQLAAVLLRKKVTGHWMRLPAEAKNSAKSILLESVTADPVQPVRRASANVVSVIAKHAVPAGEWPELLPFLFQCSKSAQEDHREVALILFSSLTETIGDVLRPHFSTLQSVFVAGLNDQQSTRVRVAALKAVGALVGYIQTEEEVIMFRELIAPILNVSRSCLESGDEDVAILAFEIFDELVESPAPLLGPTIPVIVQFALEVCSNKSLESNTRYQAIQIVSWLAKYKPKTLVKHKLVTPILTVMCPILAEPDARHSEDEVSSDRAAAEVLDTMAMSLPKKHVFPPILQFAVNNFQNPDPNWREAAVMSLGVISEGCYEVMKSKLVGVLTLVLEALKDSEQLVRGAASFALGQFAEHLQPEIVEHYERVLPCIFTVLSDPVPEVQEKAYYALAAFCENLKEEILPYLGQLMERLLEALQSHRRDLQETCMSAIGSAAAAAESSFIPYTERVLQILQNFMISTKDEDLPVRARATELVGIVGLAVGKGVIEPVLPNFIEAAIAGFALDFSELREYSHGFFSNVAEILEEGLVPYLPRLVPLALASCNLDDGTALDFDDSGDEADMANGLGGLSSDDEDESDNKRVRNISVRTGVLDEKAAATQALGLFALHTKKAFMPSFDSNSGYLSHPKQYTVMDIYLRALNEDDDKDTVSQVCSSIVDVIKSVPLEAVQQYIVKLSEATLMLLRQEAVCQQTGDTDGEGDDDDLEHDDILMDAATDLLPAMASCMGGSFEPIFRQLFEPLMKFATHSRPPNDRTMAVACVAEVAKEIRQEITPYIDTVMPIALKELSSPEPTNRRNAAYCVGELCLHGGETAKLYYMSILTALHPLFTDRETDNGVRDNAAGAVARMIKANAQAIPLSQVLPALVGVLPLKEDIEESESVYGSLCGLIFASHPDILQLIPQLVPIFAQTVASEEVKPEVKSLIGQAVNQLCLAYREQMQGLLSALPPHEASALGAVMGQH
ncbi:hypothetical protein AXG93_2960s1400 [Marchantia polymorpha subsp. ruderalis]|uniref:Importin N-terminal domain-containing protein n=1 Tax=Marchantia polymorpha subsp. ruderalis TaxID=1480154 RepID=A0A176W8M1_MARPO|nr:hypothetical protein AXG93_2960s1400 [Marchantia polymorpha subsp. ruderalis]